MSAELELLNSVLRTKDILPLLNSNTEVFKNYKDVSEFIGTHYQRYQEVPSMEFVQEKFPDFDEVKTAGPVEHYIEKAEAEYLKGEVEKIIMGAADALPKVGARRIIEGLEKKLAKLRNMNGDINVLDITDLDLAAEHYDEVRAKALASGGAIGIRTGIETIDYFYPTGMAPGHKVTLIGWPGKAKSWFAGYLAIQAWLQGYKPMIVSLEMSPVSMRDRIYTMMGQGTFTMSGLTQGDVHPDNFREWGKKMVESKQPFHTIGGSPTSAFTPRQLQARIDQYKPDLVVIDYLQLMSDDANTKEATPRNTNLSRELKNMAVVNNIALIDVTAATSKEIEDRDKAPTMGQVAWAKSIEYDADLAIAVHRHEDSGLVELVCRKNRHGEKFAVYLDWDINRGVVREHHGG